MVKERGEGLRDLEGRYANYFNVGHNAFEVVLVFGQFYEDESQPHWHTRIVTGPAYAKRLLELLKEALDRYETSFGLIQPERPHE